MKFSEGSDSIETKKLLLQFVGMVDQLIQGKQGSLSYQLAYDTVYKLTKQHKQTELLSLLDQKLGEHLRRLIEQISLKNGLADLGEVLRVVSQTSTRMTEICLFLDLNYCQKELICPLRKRLSQTVFKIFSVHPKVLDVVAAGVFQARRNRSEDCAVLLQAICEIDEKDEFFEKHLLATLLPLVHTYYQGEAHAFFEKLTIEEYLNWCRGELEEEKAFITKHFVHKRGQEGVEAVLGVVYAECVIAYKQKIYKTEQNKLFEQLTLPILQLLKWGRNKQVEGHIQWFMSAIERRLNQLPLQNNVEFLKVFCKLFEKVGVLLHDTQNKFDINYRSIFTFQEWINNEKFNIPLRLNLFIDQRLRETDQNFHKEAILVFKLVKEKTLFENIYRRMLLTRLAQNYLTYRPADEIRLVEAMEAECGQDWTKKIKSISGLFNKNREALVKYRNKQLSCGQFKEEDNVLLGGLWPVIVEEDDWPFQNRNEKISLQRQLLDLTPAFETYYLPQNKNHRLLWSPRVGTVTLSIKFNRSVSRIFVLSVDMANLVLYLQKGHAALASYLCESGYKIDDVEAGLQLLIDSKLVLSTPKGSDYILELSKQYESGAVLDLVRGKGDSKVEVRAMQELKADRKLMVQAILVKIMKSEKVVKRSELVPKTAPLLAQRGFNFNADFVEKSIDRLLDKQFLRDLEDGSVGYIA